MKKLTKEDKEALKSFNERLNSEPRPESLKERSIGGGKKSKYVVQPQLLADLHSLFSGAVKIKTDSVHIEKTKRERWDKKADMNVPYVATEPVIVVTIHVFHPIFEEWLEYSGTGSSNNFGSLDLNSVAPSAESFAFRAACKKIGKVFGRDLNRKEDEYVDFDVEPHVVTAIFIKDCEKDYESIEAFEKVIKPEYYDAHKDNPSCVKAYSAKRKELTDRMKEENERKKVRAEIDQHKKDIASKMTLTELTLSFKSLSIAAQKELKEDFSKRRVEIQDIEASKQANAE